MSDLDRTGLYQPQTAVAPSDAAAADMPQRIGRYRMDRILGQGGFGIVYLAHDEQLQRLVAIKVPHRKLVSRPEQAESYLTEARTVASLDYPHIVPVYDVGSTEEFPCYVVSKFIDGTDLKAKAQTSRSSPEECAGLVASVADALHHAHKQGIVHRDIKPGNILLDTTGKPYVADFGLALKEEDFGKGTTFAGTPAYMSPEQAQGGSDRVDGRSDIFSLGVIFYELLTGRRPFRADTWEELREQITSVEVRPPRQWDDTIPRELERICLKALSKRASERYTTAKDMADELRHFLHSIAPQPTAGQTAGRMGSAPNPLHLIWDSLDPLLQDAFSLAYNKKVREGSSRISTRDLFQALVRVEDNALQTLFESLPSGALPAPVPADVAPDGRVLEANPLLSDCVEESLSHFIEAGPLPRPLSPVDIFVDIGQYGHGPSVAKLREHGITPEELERRVRKYRLPVLRRKKSK